MKIIETGVVIGVGETYSLSTTITEEINGIEQNIIITPEHIVRTAIDFEGILYGQKIIDYYEPDFSKGIINTIFDSSETMSIPAVGLEQDAKIIIWIEKIDKTYSTVFLATLRISQTNLTNFNI